MTERDTSRESGDRGDTDIQETGDGTNSSGQSGNVGVPADDAGAVNQGGAGDSATGNPDGEEGGGPGSR